MAKPKKDSKKVTKKPNPRSVTFDEFKTFIVDHICYCEMDGGGELSQSFPDFELMPRDYLMYAIEALETPTAAIKVNCISNLKRAAECQADTLLFMLSLSNHKKVQNFPSKINFIGSLGLMPSRSIAELNRVRNKMEHEYSVPILEDLYIYFDLVSAFVSAVEGSIFMLKLCGEIEFRNSLDKFNLVDISLKYVIQGPEVVCEMSNGSGTKIFRIGPEDWDVWIESLRIYFLLLRYDTVISHEHFLKYFDNKSTLSHSDS